MSSTGEGTSPLLCPVQVVLLWHSHLDGDQGLHWPVPLPGREALLREGLLQPVREPHPSRSHLGYQGALVSFPDVALAADKLTFFQWEGA